MLYCDLKKMLHELKIEESIKSFKGFEESLKYEYFKTVFRLIDEPEYTLMQFKNSEEFGTSSENWIICIPNDEQMCVIDFGTEDDICEQFYHLMEIFKFGFGTIKTRKKDQNIQYTTLYD